MDAGLPDVALIGLPRQSASTACESGSRFRLDRLVTDHKSSTHPGGPKFMIEKTRLDAAVAAYEAIIMYRGETATDADSRDALLREAISAAIMAVLGPILS